MHPRPYTIPLTENLSVAVKGLTTEQRDTNLYRIMDFAKVVQIFERKELYFANPTVWDDPWEARLKHHKNDSLFAQCWGELGVSDAMWRIYSQNGMGVRIPTTASRLRKALKAATSTTNLRFRLEPVTYLPQKSINSEAKKIKASLDDEFDIRRAVDMLYYKRDAFEHEHEWRATIFISDAEKTNGKLGVTVPIDPHSLIKNILLDPRAPKELVNAFQYYFKSKLEFKGAVKPSVLYKVPSLLEVNSIRAEDL